MSVGEEIVKLRTMVVGCSQTVFADMLCKDQRTISSYERDIISPPLDVLEQISKDFNMKIEITPTGVTFKEIVDMRKDIREEMFNFIINNTLSDDFKKEDLLSYEYLIREYKDILPSEFEEDIKKLGLDTRKVYGAITKDEFAQLGVFYLGEQIGTTLLYCDKKNNNWWSTVGRYRVVSDNNIEERYVYAYNPLWLVYLERDKDEISKEDFIEAFYSHICGLLVEGDDRINNLEEIDIELLKEYTSDYSLDKEYVKAYVWDRGDGYMLIDRYFENDANNKEYARFKHLVEIPSKEILICADGIDGRGNIVVKGEYQRMLREKYLD